MGIYLSRSVPPASDGNDETEMENKSTLKYIAEIAGRTRWKIALLLFLQAVIALSNVGCTLVLRDLIDAAVAGRREIFLSRVLAFVGLICVRVVAGSVRRFLQEDISSELENKWKKRLLSALLKRDYGAIAAVHSGEWMTRLTNDTVVVANGMTNLLPDIAGMIVRLAGAAGAIIVIEPRFLYLLIPGGTAMILVSYLSRKRMKRMHREVQEADGRLRTYLQECFTGMLVVRSYGTENVVLDQAAEKMGNHKTARMHRNEFFNVCSTGFSVLMNGIYAVGAVFCGYGILMNTISYGTLVAVLQLVGQLQGPLANISGVLPRFYAMLASAERLLEAEKLDCATQNQRKTLEEVQKMYRKLDKIVLENIFFSYLRPVQSFGSESSLQDNLRKENEPFLTLSDWNFEIHKGEYVALTGPSGCGKSTLLKLLMCLYKPDQGSRYLQLDDETIPLDGTWQRLFAYVPQGNYLMSGTIRDVVTFADPDRMKEDEAIWNALSIACADEFVRKLEHGLDSVLGERGTGLSEGQMQRLAIARAIFSGCPVLILDECSSALDEDMEGRLLQNLRAMTDKTVVIITHRPAALQICDRIWKVDDKIALTRGEHH